MHVRLKQVLARISETPEREARWLNTVSLLEFTGARKIGRTVADRHPSLEVLQHLADETRHALALKRLAIEVALFEILLAALEQEVGFAVSERPPVPGDQFRDGYTPPRQIT